MKKILTLVYVFAALLAAIGSTVMQIQPALFLINLFAPEEGDSFPLTLVFLLTFLLFLLPFLLLMFISFLMNSGKNNHPVIESGRTGVFIKRKKQLQSALVAIPVFIDDVKAGTIDNRKERFFDVKAGKFVICAGKGKSTSEQLELELLEGQQLRLEFEIQQNGLGLTYVLNVS